MLGKQSLPLTQATGVGAVQLEAQGALTDQALLGADAAAVNAAAFIGVLL